MVVLDCKFCFVLCGDSLTCKQSYLNPMTYAFSGIMENEFMRTSLICDGSYVVPRNGLGMTKYPWVVPLFKKSMGTHVP